MENTTYACPRSIEARIIYKKSFLLHLEKIKNSLKVFMLKPKITVILLVSLLFYKNPLFKYPVLTC